MKISIPGFIQDILKTIEENGFSAYVVGGCVRDSIMGNIPNDWDIAASSLPNETLKIFKDRKTVENGKKYGTVGVVTEHGLVEITTFRSDREYDDCRRPSSVDFVRTIDEDLARRDFTVNAMAYNNKTGIIDPFGGRADIKNKIIRCVNEPKKRFEEDALRIMRALRFSAVLGFEIEPKTASAMSERKALLKNIAAERISDELKKIMAAKSCADVLKKYPEIIFEIIPELSEQHGCCFEEYSDITLWEHTVKAVSLVPNDLTLRLTMLLHDVAKMSSKIERNSTEQVDNFVEQSAVTARDILKRLKFDRATTSSVTDLIKLYSEELPPNMNEMRLFAGRVGLNTARDWLKIKRADIISKPHKQDLAYNLANAERMLCEIAEKNLCCCVGQLMINGNDIKKLGAKGREIGTILNTLLEKVIDGTVQNTKENLLEYAKLFLIK